jgi:hypothetical protein
MKNFFSKFAYSSFFMFGLIFGLLMIPVGYISWEIYFGTPIQTLNSEGHTATLRRMFGIIDYNLVVEVDGKRVYHSGDIWGISERQLRATLVWDKTGRVVAYEQMGKIVFAYDAQEKRTIGNDELKDYCLSPMPETYELYFQNSCKNE